MEKDSSESPEEAVSRSKGAVTWNPGNNPGNAGWGTKGGESRGGGGVELERFIKLWGLCERTKEEGRGIV